MLMRLALFIPIVSVLTACAAPRSNRAYSYQRPITDETNRAVSVSEADWTACDHRSDNRAIAGAQKGYVIYSGNPAVPNTFVSEGTNWSYADHLYEYEMRKCLRKRGYPVKFTPRGYDAEDGFQ